MIKNLVKRHRRWINFSANLSQKADENKIDPVVGPDKKIERVIQILARRSKNNPILIGKPGVGKTAVAEGLALRISMGDIPKMLQGKVVASLDIGLLVASTKYRSEFEERIKKIMEMGIFSQGCNFTN